MAYFEVVAGLVMLVASAILLGSYILPRFDPGASRSAPHMIIMLLVALLLWCAGAQLMSWSVSPADQIGPATLTR